MSFTLAAGAQQQCTYSVLDSLGNVLHGVGNPQWSSSDTSVATVGSNGVVTGVSGGTAIISAQLGGVVGTTVATILPSSPQQFVTMFNAFGSAAARTGMTIQWGHLTGVNDTVAGGFCTRRENIVSPGDGNHLRPSPGNPSGASVNGLGNLVSKGLYCPGTAPYFAALNYRDDPTTVLQVTGILPNPLFDDTGAGLTVINVSKLLIGTWSWRWGAQSAANTFGFGGDSINGPNFEALKDPNANAGSPFTLGVGSTMMVCDSHLVHTQFGPGNGVQDGNFQYNVYGRDLLQDVGYQIAGNFYANGRDFFVLENNGFDPSTANELAGQFIGAGAMNSTQTKFLHDWVATQPWASAPWTDTRNLGLIFGDSELDTLINIQADGIDHVGHIVRGYHGRARIPNFAAVRYARAGNTPDAYQAPFLKWMARRDFSNRAKLVAVIGEYNNSTLDAAGILAENYTWAAQAKATLGTKCKVIGTSRIYDTPLKKSQYEPAVWADLSVNSPAHYDGLINTHDAEDYDILVWRDGTFDVNTGQRTTSWVAGHPREPEQQEVLECAWVSACLMGLGTDMSNVPLRIKPSVAVVSLIAAGSTYASSWTPIRNDGVALGGRTLAFTSRDTTIATVDASTGVVTPQNKNGEVGIDCWSNDGYKGVLIVAVSGAPIVSHTFTAADNATVVPSADTGQATIVRSTGLWGISSNQLYHSGDSGSNKDALVWDSGVSDCTVQVTYTVAKAGMRLRFRDTDLDNGFIVDADFGGFLKTYRQQAGSYTDISSSPAYTPTNGDIIKVVLSGTSITVFVNGVLKDTITSSFNQTATKHGVAENAIFGTSRWDNFKVT